jgi:hypothetical protein
MDRKEGIFSENSGYTSIKQEISPLHLGDKFKGYRINHRRRVLERKLACSDHSDSHFRSFAMCNHYGTWINS